MDSTRLNKYLAACGVDSRRGCDALILEGRVEVNGHPCLKPGTQVKEGDHVRVDGKRVTMLRTTTILLNKPRGLVCSKDDELGRETIFTLLPVAMQHLHHVGRLDADSEGLLILTNDGDLTQRLMHPRNKVEKEYLVTSNQPYQQEHLDLFLSGVYSKEGKLSAKSLRRMSARRISMVLDQGAKRQIRVMHETLGYQVLKLVRVRIGTLWGGDLEVGRFVLLGPEEILKASTNPETVAPKSLVRREGKPAAAKKFARKGAKPMAKKTARKSASKRRFDSEPPAKKGSRATVNRPRKY
jgi:23S rRNA pseudouridine2605 synthase